MLGAAGIVEQLADCSRGHHRFGVVGCPPRESFALRESQLVAPLWGQDGSVGPLGDAGLGGPAAHAQRVVVGECGHSSWGGLRRGQQLGGQLSAFWLRHILCELHPCGIDILHDLGVPGDGSHGRRLWLPHRRHSRSRRGEARLERAAGHPPQDLGDHRAMLRGALGRGDRHSAVVACRLPLDGFESPCDTSFSAKRDLDCWHLPDALHGRRDLGQVLACALAGEHTFFRQGHRARAAAHRGTHRA
mmetsp:Transcript_7223/g.21839  ORF Transcript_7223/g.21839 Transcript_7223/m.21839 type:complete len:246 (-) Transcript_7223:75-812(-)